MSILSLKIVIDNRQHNEVIKMDELIELIYEDSQQLKLKIKNINELDSSVFQLMKIDESCIPCVLMDEKKGVISYSINGFIRLSDVLKQHVFEKEEGYLFFHQLFDDMVVANRDKAILMDPNFVYVGLYGDTFHFISLPIKRQSKLMQEKVLRKWIEILSKSFQTTTSYELPGYFIVFSQSKEFTLSNLILGLEAIQRKYYPKKFSFFFKHKKKGFRVSEPMHPIYQEERMQIPIEQNRLEQTMLLGQINRDCAYLMIEGQRYDLLHEVNLIGRSMACDLRIQNSEISQKHAKITCQNQRYYIQDLKSRNGTYLEEKKVIRKMRLKNKMHIRFASTEAIFFQE